METKKYLKTLICPKCSSDRLFLEEFLQPMGCWVQLVVYCDDCHKAVYIWNLNKDPNFSTAKPDIAQMPNKPNPYQSSDEPPICVTCHHSGYGQHICDKSGNEVGKEGCPRDKSFDDQFELPKTTL